MAIFKVFDTRELEEFATTSRPIWPPVSAGVRGQDGTGRGAPDQGDPRRARARAVRYHEQHKLGVYKKAKLGNAFKWKLRELGYSAEFADNATQRIVTRLAVKKSI